MSTPVPPPRLDLLDWLEVVDWLVLAAAAICVAVLVREAVRAADEEE